MVEKIMFILLLIILIVVLIFIPIDEQNYIYKCTDTQGNVIYCINARTTKGGMFGIMEDGTKVTITSYKRVNIEGADIDE